MPRQYIHNTLPTLPSDRSFGILFTVVFTLGFSYSFYKSFSLILTATLGVAALMLLIVAFVAPKLLSPFNRVWFALGLLLGKIVSPIVLGVIFFLLITPVAFITRVFGRDELKLKKRSVESYWVNRDPAGPGPASFKNQF